MTTLARFVISTCRTLLDTSSSDKDSPLITPWSLSVSLVLIHLIHALHCVGLVFQSEHCVTVSKYSACVCAVIFIKPFWNLRAWKCIWTTGIPHQLFCFTYSRGLDLWLWQYLGAGGSPCATLQSATWDSSGGQLCPCCSQAAWAPAEGGFCCVVLQVTSRKKQWWWLTCLWSEQNHSHPWPENTANHWSIVIWVLFEYWQTFLEFL